MSLTSFQVNYSSNIDQIELSNLPNLNIFLLFSLFFFFFFFKQKIYLDPQPTTQFHREPSLILSTSSLGNATPFTTINRSIRYVSKKKKKESYRISFRTNLQRWIISMRLRGKFNSKVFFLIFFREIG